MLPEADPDSDAPVVEVTVTEHGPLRRYSCSRAAPRGRAQLSVYRLGDALVDTGGTRVTRALLAALAADPPRRILLTHQHEDHVGNVMAIRRALGDLPVLAPRALIDVIASTSRVPGYRAFYWGHPEAPTRDVLVPYDPGDELDVGVGRVRAVATPGHTPPHIAFLFARGGREWALSGDLYTSKPLDAWLESNTPDAIASYRALAARGARLTLLPTHGRTRDDAAALLTLAADWLERESESVHAASARLGTRDPNELVRALYGTDPLQRVTEGEICRALFVRSVLDPVTELPARRVALA